ncbi:MAG: hypothetical protein EGP82_02080 [Odoribacter splanchnicus]|nr:hypothetical protein [Odoribacter splanchnicus]
MEKNRQIITAPETDDVARLFEAYKAIPGNDAKTQADFWLFITTPSPERLHFLESKAKCVPEYTDNLVHDIYEVIC